jgi:ribosomal protein S18 acetylase RimI-like enzyme
MGKGGELMFRDATRSDLGEVVRLILADSLSAALEAGLDEAAPLRAFEAIEGDANNRLIVAEQDGAIVGTMQLTFIPTLTLRGGWIEQIENVRIDGSLRSQGLGRQMIEWAIERARERGCGLVQLSSNQQRERAHAFYRRLGFAQSHAGFKLAP